MATIGNLALTLTDWAKRVDPNGSIATVIELLNQDNSILDDMLWLEANSATGHRTTVRTGLPTATWRKLNYGVPKGKSTTAQVTDTMGMLEVYAEIDKDLANFNSNVAAFRMSEDMAFLEGINQQMATALFYETELANPERLTGLAPRYSSLAAGNGVNIIDALGSGSDNTSIYLVCWSDRTVAGIFPKGSKAGISQEDLGIQTVLDGNTPPGQFQAYRTHYQWKAGLSLRDWRYVVRVANIDVSDLAGVSPANLITLLIRAIHKIPSMAPYSKLPAEGVSRAAIYVNRAVATWLDIQALNKTNVWLGREEWAGKMVTMFRGIPIRTVDAILNTEARVT